MIECFDISNISGTQSVGSMVVSLSGQPSPKGYRRFRIKEVKGIDDPRSIAEVVFRRYHRMREQADVFPDLIIVDGGITQLRAAKAALEEMNLGMHALVGLAKKNEEIITDEVDLPRSIQLDTFSPSRRIITQLRDEAHRFALDYHRKLRAKRIQESILDHIPELATRRKALLAILDR